jgi:hypothetical protein
MARGGYRPGAGRKKGQKDVKPRKGSTAEIEAKKIKEMLANDLKVKARFYQEFLIRVSKGDKLSIAEKKLMDKLAVELAAGTEGNKSKGEVEVLDPLAYMLKVMNDPNEDKELRARMAQAAAPYIHPRKGEGQGKKDDKADKAKAAGAGKFAPSKPPLKMVK